MKILIFGAGRSSVYLIVQMQQYCDEKKGDLTLFDLSFKNLPNTLTQHSRTCFVESEVENNSIASSQIETHDIIISMLPPKRHLKIANWCLEHGKDLITASYVSKEMMLLDAEAQRKGLLFLNEVGVDPGLDHISALSFLDTIKAKGGVIKSFKSHTGGIVAEKNPENLWDYKITWNPKNVVRAGGEGAIFLHKKEQLAIAYPEVFLETQSLSIYDTAYDSYPNRDSLKYIEKYALQGVETCYRGTLRHQGFCEAWNVFVQLGMTEDSKIIEFEKGNSRQDFLAFFLDKGKYQSVKQAFVNSKDLTVNKSIVEKFNQLGFFETILPLELLKGTAAQILQQILIVSWQITPAEKDMLLMYHEVEFELHGEVKKATSSLKVVGQDQYCTAMAITVGATLFEAFKLVVEKKVVLKGVCIPTEKSIYTQLIKAVEKHHINFDEVFL